MQYPGGVRNEKQRIDHTRSTYSHRGMSLEDDLNITNEYYLEINKAIIHKKPTPIQVVNVHYPKRSAAMITEGYFKQASTTDYNGIYRGKYIDFEAKETKNKTSFPLANIHAHQMNHMRSILEHDGITFAIFRFTSYNETYLLPAEQLIKYWDEQQQGGRKSIPYKTFKKHGYLIPFKYHPRVAYLDIVDKLYF